jgi:serine/threonine protein kinase
LAEHVKFLNSNTLDLYNFIYELLLLLADLERNEISHRDIHPDNIIVAKSRPMLIDFGWATDKKNKIFVPKGLGNTKYYNGQLLFQYSNTQSFGLLIEWLNQKLDPKVELLTFVMKNFYPEFDFFKPLDLISFFKYLNGSDIAEENFNNPIINKKVIDNFLLNKTLNKAIDEKTNLKQHLKKLKLFFSDLEQEFYLKKQEFSLKKQEFNKNNIELNDEINELQIQLTGALSTTEELHPLKTELDTINIQLRLSQLELKTIKNSRTWRMTGPIRNCIDLIKKVFNCL